MKAESLREKVVVQTHPPQPKWYAKITSVALSIIALFLTGAGLILMGLQTLPATMHIGYGVALFFIGAQISAIGGGQGVAAAGFASNAIYLHSKQKLSSGLGHLSGQSV